MYTLSELALRNDPDLMRLWIAERLSARLAVDRLPFNVIPNTADLNCNMQTGSPLYPCKMSFTGVFLKDGAKFKLSDIISINQTPDDLEWSIAATYAGIAARFGIA